MSAPYPKTSALNTVIIVLVHTGVTVSFCPQDTTNNNIFFRGNNIWKPAGRYFCFGLFSGKVCLGLLDSKGELESRRTRLRRNETSVVTGSFKQHDGMLKEQELQTQWMLPRGLENDVPMNKKTKNNSAESVVFRKSPKSQQMTSLSLRSMWFLRKAEKKENGC